MEKRETDLDLIDKQRRWKLKTIVERVDVLQKEFKVFSEKCPHFDTFHKKVPSHRIRCNNPTREALVQECVLNKCPLRWEEPKQKS